MDNFTQLGISGLTLAILFFIVKYFIEEMKGNRRDTKELTQKFITLSEESTRTNNSLIASIDANTKATKESTDSSKLSSDKLTELILKLVTK